MKLLWIVHFTDYSQQQNITLAEKYRTTLANAAAHHNCTFDFIDAAQLHIEHSNGTTALLYHGQNLLLNDTAFLISNFSINPQREKHLQNIYHTIHASEATLLNRCFIAPEHLERNKLAMGQLAASLNIPTLATIHVPPIQCSAAAERFFHQHATHEGIIGKPNDLAMGTGIFRARSISELHMHWNMIQASSIDYILQPYLPHHQDVRIYLVNHRIVATQCRTPQNDDFRANISTGAQHIPSCIPSSIHQHSRTLSRTLGADYCCIDWLIQNETYYFNELGTTACGFSGLPDRARHTMAMQLMRYTQQRISNRMEATHATT